MDKNQNDRNDTLLINELYGGRVDAIITEDKKLLVKASLLGIADRVYTIDAFLEKVTAENPELADYRVLAVQKSTLVILTLLMISSHPLRMTTLALKAGSITRLMKRSTSVVLRVSRLPFFI